MPYLDNNATTQPTPAVRAAVDSALTEFWHNPSSVHRPGQAARQQVELARQDLARLVGAKPRNLVLTASGTESIDLAIRGRIAATGKQTIVTAKTEHAAVRDLAEELQRTGHEVRYARPNSDGVITAEAVEPLLDDSVALVSLMWANNETGAVQPVADIAELCASRSIAYHCDATQWVGKQPCDLSAPDTPPIDLLTFSCHKFHGPKGVGALIIKPGTRIRPVTLGSQELGRRGGTENVPGVLGAAAAAREAIEWLADANERERLAALRDRFERAVLDACPQAAVNGPTGPERRLWNTTNIAFPRLEAEALLLSFSERGLCASAGAACSSGSLDPSPVLLAMGVAPEYAHGSVRFSLSRFTTGDEIDQAVETVAACAARLAGSAPLA